MNEHSLTSLIVLILLSCTKNVDVLKKENQGCRNTKNSYLRPQHSRLILNDRNSGEKILSMYW